MQRSSDNRRSPAEIKADLQQHYGGLEKRPASGHAARHFVHKAYELYSVKDGDKDDGA